MLLSRYGNIFTLNRTIAHIRCNRLEIASKKPNINKSEPKITPEHGIRSNIVVPFFNR
jgi:hypothetical protein